MVLAEAKLRAKSQKNQKNSSRRREQGGVWQSVKSSATHRSAAATGATCGIDGHPTDKNAKLRIHFGGHMRHLLLLSVLLLGAAWVVAQNYPSQTSPSQTNPDQTTPTATGAQTTVQGCLSGSSGNYILTDKNGNTYQITGDTSKLNEHLGHEVQIKGTASSASASAGTTSGTASSTTGQKSGSSQQMLDVSSVTHISKTCQSSSPR